MAQYKTNSNLRSTPVNNGVLDLYVPPVEVDYTKTTVVTLDQKYNKRPDLLAFELYGDAKLWWIFTVYNRNQLLDPINDFVTGLTIYAPTRNYIAGL
jgi:hypothetical protein